MSRRARPENGQLVALHIGVIVQNRDGDGRIRRGHSQVIRRRGRICLQGVAEDQKAQAD